MSGSRRNPSYPRGHFNFPSFPPPPPTFYWRKSLGKIPLFLSLSPSTLQEVPHVFAGKNCSLISFGFFANPNLGSPPLSNGHLLAPKVLSAFLQQAISLLLILAWTKKRTRGPVRLKIEPDFSKGRKGRRGRRPQLSYFFSLSPPLLFPLSL